jgi:serine/threonine protein kinase
MRGDDAADGKHPLFDRRTGADYAKKYRFVKLLGEGHSSQVYLVRRRGTPDYMAMKVMQCKTDADLTNAFSEYMSMKRLQGHPNIVELIDMTMTMEELPELQPEPVALGGRSYSVGSQLDLYGQSTSSPKLARQASAYSSRSHTPAGKAGAGGFDRWATTSTPDVEPNPRSPSRLSSSMASNGSGYNVTPQKTKTTFTCLLMRYYQEGTLEQGIRDDPKYFNQPRVVASYMMQLLSALSHSHAQNIAHFDLKPGNVLLMHKRATIVVSDFGLARTMQDQGDGDPGSIEIGGGTLFFQAPEQLERRSTLRSDVWGLACTVVAMVMSRVGSNTVPMFYWRAEADFDNSFRAKMRDFSLPDPIIALLLSMLALKPSDRPRMEECYVRLDRVLDQLGFSPTLEERAASP